MESGQCLNRLLALIEDYCRTKPLLIYSALELRFSIERTLFEYLGLIHNLELSKHLEKLYSAKDLRSAILNEEPKFYEKIEFMATLAPYMGTDREVRKPDLELLADCYAKLGDYLHAPKRPEKSWQDLEWWTRLENTISKGMKHLIWVHEGALGFIELNDQGQALFDRFVSGEMSLSDAKSYLDDYYQKKTEPTS
jgi:hypothetical protein